MALAALAAAATQALGPASLPLAGLHAGLALATAVVAAGALRAAWALSAPLSPLLSSGEEGPGLALSASLTAVGLALSTLAGPLLLASTGEQGGRAG